MKFFGVLSFLILLTSASVTDHKSIRGRVITQLSSSEIKIFLETDPGKKRELCLDDDILPIQKLSGFTVSISGLPNPIEKDCFKAQQIQILKFPFGATATVGKFVKKQLHGAIFQDRHGQLYEFFRIPETLLDIEGPVILTLALDNPLIPSTKKWMILTYSEYPFDAHGPYGF